MFDRGKLDLELGLWGFGMELKNLEYQIYSIPDLYVHFSLLNFLDNSIDLSWFKDISNNQSVCF